MKYFYEPPENWTVTKGFNASCDHPLYNRATLFNDDSGRGVAVIQQRYNSNTKMTWWGPIDPWLIDDIVAKDLWKDWFEKNSDYKDSNGLFPTFTIREVMWAMRMKPLKRQIFEGHIHWR